MSTLLVWREQIQRFYAGYSTYIRKVLHLILGLLVFGLINANVGYMKAASSMVCTIGLSVVCAFFPLIIMVMAATALLLLHFYTLSLPIALVSGMLFLLMYIFYFRFSPGKAWLVLLTMVAFALKIPLVIPVAVGLLGTPVCVVPAACGTFSYYMIHFVKGSSSTFKAEDAAGLVESLMTFMKQAVANKEMWIMVAAVSICLLLVYGIRTRSMDHAWKVASVVGAILAVVIGAVGNGVLDVHISLSSLISGGVLAIVTGLLLELLFLSVDYSRTEHLEFEDDEYHYYVKAVPKIGVTVPEKSVKHINERQSRAGNSRNGEVSGRARHEGQVNRSERSKSADEILLTRSLNKELGLDRKGGH